MNSSNWWASKLGAPQQPRPIYTQPVQQQPVQQPPIQQQQPQRLPESAVTQSKCPGCGSGNYGSGVPGVRARCYDCGYPITQSGTGMPGVKVPVEGGVQAAKQISTANNFNPQGIIGKIE